MHRFDYSTRNDLPYLSTIWSRFTVLFSVRSLCCCSCYAIVDAMMSNVISMLVFSSHLLCVIFSIIFSGSCANKCIVISSMIDIPVIISSIWAQLKPHLRWWSYRKGRHRQSPEVTGSEVTGSHVTGSHRTGSDVTEVCSAHARIFPALLSYYSSSTNVLKKIRENDLCMPGFFPYLFSASRTFFLQ
jgi:hypothetical protein